MTFVGHIVICVPRSIICTLAPLGRKGCYSKSHVIVLFSKPVLTHKQWGNLRITRHTDRPRQKTARMYQYLDSEMSHPGLIARLLRFSPALSHFLLLTHWSPPLKTVIHCLKSCKEFLANPSASAQTPLFYCLLREIQRTSSTESSSSRIRRHFDSTTQQQQTEQTKCKSK